jgi:hypothetical protein
MKFNCAAKQLCGMPQAPVEAGRHACLNCAISMHGGLCGYEFPDGLPGGVAISSLVDNLSQRGQDIVARQNNNLLLCFICYNSIIGNHSSKTPPCNEVYQQSPPVAKSPTREENIALHDDTIGDVTEDITDLNVDPPIVENKATCTLSPCKDATSEVDGRSKAGEATTGESTLVPALPSFEQSDAEFRKQFYINIDKYIVEVSAKQPLYRPLFKTREEALTIIKLLKEWDNQIEGGKKRTKHTKSEYKTRERFVLSAGHGTNALHHRDTDTRVVIYEDMFNVILDAHLSMGHARTARNILNSLKETWFGITQRDIQILIDLCPTCVGNTSRIRAKQTPLKMIFSPTIGHRAQVDLVDMSS